MLLAAHISVSAAICSVVSNPYLAVALSFISYYLLNCIPHWIPQFKSKKNKIIYIASDYLLAAGTLALLLLFLPNYINNNNSLYSFNLSIYTLIAASIVSVLPDFISMIYKLSKKSIKFLDWNEYARKFAMPSDRKVLGKLIHIATIFVFAMYAFRQLPNSESSLFVQIIILMLFVVGVLAILETFSSDTKPE
ncbi:MAG: hypothetical protein WCJ19_03110 [bacterium]